MSADRHTRNMMLVLLARLFEIAPDEARARLRTFGFEPDDVTFRTARNGQTFVEVKRWPWDRGEPVPEPSRPSVRGRDKVIRDIENATMSPQQAYKAFRIGVLATGLQLPEGESAQNAFWRLMRSRFNAWFADYIRGKQRSIAAVLEHQAPRPPKPLPPGARVNGRRDEPPAAEPFNPPRLTPVKET